MNKILIRTKDKPAGRFKDLDCADTVSDAGRNLVDQVDNLQPAAGVQRATTATNNENPAVVPEKTAKDVTKLGYTWFDTCIYTFSIISYIADVSSDMFLAYIYYRDDRMLWFGLTLTFVFVPSLIIAGFSTTWYIQDAGQDEYEGVHCCVWLLRLIFMVLQLTPVVRYMEIIYYGHSYRRGNKKYLKSLLEEDADNTLLRLFECFMEAAPQVTLQIYILCGGYTTENTQYNTIYKMGQSASIVTSLFSMSWALASYGRSLRLALKDKEKLSYVGMIVQVVWRFLTIGCRVVVLALFASVFHFWVLVVVVSHWLIMLTWILLQRTNFCINKPFQEFLFDLVVSFVHIYCFVNLMEGHTRVRYVFYYTVCYVENIVLISLWYTAAETLSAWYIVPALVLVVVGYLVGIAFMLVYYKYFHPNVYPLRVRGKAIEVCVPWQDLWQSNNTQVETPLVIYVSTQ